MTVSVEVKFQIPVGNIQDSSAYIDWIMFKMKDGSYHELEFAEYDRLQGEDPDVIRFICQSPDFPPLWKKEAIAKWLTQIDSIAKIHIHQLSSLLYPVEVTAFDIVLPAGYGQIQESALYTVTTNEFATIGSISHENLKDVLVTSDADTDADYAYCISVVLDHPVRNAFEAPQPKALLLETPDGHTLEVEFEHWFTAAGLGDKHTVAYEFFAPTVNFNPAAVSLKKVIWADPKDETSVVSSELQFRDKNKDNAEELFSKFFS